MHLHTEFHLPVFNRSEVILLTNKQTHKQMDTTETRQHALIFPLA